MPAIVFTNDPKLKAAIEKEVETLRQEVNEVASQLDEPSERSLRNFAQATFQPLEDISKQISLEESRLVNVNFSEVDIEILLECLKWWCNEMTTSPTKTYAEQLGKILAVSVSEVRLDYSMVRFLVSVLIDVVNFKDNLDEVSRIYLHYLIRNL